MQTLCKRSTADILLSALGPDVPPAVYYSAFGPVIRCHISTSKGTRRVWVRCYSTTTEILPSEWSETKCYSEVSSSGILGKKANCMTLSTLYLDKFGSIAH